jgi:hypothetical protein
MRTPSLDRIAFVVSLAVLAWLYGFATSARGWFPNDLLVRAWDQARALASSQSQPPIFLEPKVHDRAGVRTADPTSMQSGLTLVASVWKDSTWTHGLRLFDADGRIVHRWPVETSELVPDSLAAELPDPQTKNLHGVHLFRDGDVLVNFDYVVTARLDACGDVMWRLPARTHHSIARADDGAFWIPVFNEDDAPRVAERPGQAPWSDAADNSIAKVNARGEIVRVIDVLELLHDNDLERYVVKTHRAQLQSDGVLEEPDITHLNDVEVLTRSIAGEYATFDAGDLLVSLRNLDLVFVFDPETGRVKWHAFAPLIHQHDPDFIGDGWIGVFDNRQDFTERGTILSGTRIVAFQPDADSTRILFPTAESEPFYTEAMGKWQHLPNGNLLLTESQAGRVVEVGPNGRTIWEWVHEPHGPHVPEVTAATRHDLTADQVASWPCSQVSPDSGSRESPS